MHVHTCDQPTLLQASVEASWYLYVSAPKPLFTGPNFIAPVNSFIEAGRRVREDTGNHQKREEDLAVTVIAMTGREEDISKYRTKLKPPVLLLTHCYSVRRPTINDAITNFFFRIVSGRFGGKFCKREWQVPLWKKINDFSFVGLFSLTVVPFLLGTGG